MDKIYHLFESEKKKNLNVKVLCQSVTQSEYFDTNVELQSLHSVK